MSSIYHGRPTPGQMKRLGDRIRSIRMALGLSQPGFAEAVNASQPAVSAWELGKRLPEPENLKAVAAVTPDPKAFLAWLSDTSPAEELIPPAVHMKGFEPAKGKDGRRGFTTLQPRREEPGLKEAVKELEAAIAFLAGLRESLQGAEASLRRASRHLQP